MNSIEREFSETLTILSDFKKDAKYLVAFSGGSDSLALLSLCAEAVGVKRIIPVYVNHNLRSEKELNKEIELNKANCSKLGLNLLVKTVEHGLIEQNAKNIGIEAAARKFRYEILESERINSGCDFILTAHHKDDQVETVLMKIIKKAPITGLRGISEKYGCTLRPLLEFKKSELNSYLEKKGLKASFDSTNNDNSFTRNEVRNIILPELRKIMTDCDQRILKIRSRALQECSPVEVFSDNVPVDKLLTYNRAQQTMVLFKIWDNVMGTSMPQTLVDRVLENLGKKDLFKESSNGGVFYSYNGILYLVNNKLDDLVVKFECKFEEQCESYLLPNNLIIRTTDRGNSTDISIDFSLFKGQPVVRFPREEERIVLKDGSKTIGKLLQDMKIPEVFRNQVPVIADNDGICVVFGTPFGGKNRICRKLRTSLAPNKFIKYICYKGNYAYEKE